MSTRFSSHSYLQKGMKMSVALWLFRFRNRNSCISRSQTSTELLDKKSISSFFCFFSSSFLYSFGISRNGSWVKKNVWKDAIQYIMHLMRRACIKKNWIWLITLLRRSICSDLSEVKSCHRATQCFRPHLPKVFSHDNERKHSGSDITLHFIRIMDSL